MNLTLKTVWYGSEADNLDIKVEIANSTVTLPLDDDIKKALLEVLQSAAETQFARRFIAKEALGKLDENDVAGVLAAGAATQPDSPASQDPDPPPSGHSVPNHGAMDNMMRNIAVDIARKP